MNNLCLCFLLLLMNIYGMDAQSNMIDQARKLIYEGYLTGDESYWDRGIGILENQVATSSALKAKVELSIALYGKIGFEMAGKSENTAEKIADKTVALLEPLVGKNDQTAEVYAVLGSVYALKIAISPAKALYLGPKSASLLEKGIALNPESAVAWCELGNMRLHAPRLFGGSVDEAIECFSKAVSLFEKNGQTRSWQYLHAMVWLGKAYEEKGSWNEACDAYAYALRKEPSLKWVKEELLPQALAKKTR
ncbi:MAG: hypothetical protein R3C61_12160 [Bacteroidia bacterium]